VIVASVYIRVSQAGPGWSGPAGFARIVHRLAASTAAVLVVLVLVVCWRARREWAGGALTAAAIATMSLFLALLGIVTAEAHPPAVTLGNLLGGMALLGMLWSLRLQARNATPHARCAAAPWMWAGVVLLATQIALGGLVSAWHAATSCVTLPACEGEWWPAGASPALPDPARTQDILSGADPSADPRLRALHMTHRFGAAVLVLYWTALALALRSRQRAAASGAAAVTVMLLGQAVLGVIVVASGAAIAGVVAHNAWAALTVLAAISAVSRCGTTGEAVVPQPLPP
jgi:cytochrome c oxidase assembly protein subunit 15